MTLESIGIEELELGVRAYNVLKRAGIHTLGQLSQVTVEDVNEWAHNNERMILGYKSALQIMDAQRYIANCQ